MARITKGDQAEINKLEYAFSLIDTLAEQDDEPRVILEKALRILEFGELTPKQALDYLEAVR